MSLRHKSIEELLDLEEEYRMAHVEERDGAVHMLIDLYETLYKRISRDEINEYRFSLEKIKSHLISYLVQYGTYLKNVYQKDDMAAGHCLKKAIQYERDLPIVHYRLGFLDYKKENYYSALLNFKNAINYQKKATSTEYRMNDQQLYNCHLFLANCGLFIAQQAQEDLEKLDLQVDMNAVSNYQMSPYLQLIKENEGYLDRHAYQILSISGSRYASIEECDRQLEVENTVILDFTGRQDLLIFNGRETRITKNQSELLQYLLTNTDEEHPATIHDVFDLFARENENAEIPRNTYTQKVTRLKAKLVQSGINDNIIENKMGYRETAYYYNHKLPYLIMLRIDEAI
ncbi:hypothetical protein [Bacillus sp. MRMR6]|uniref:hypothetical protein n=1 Tax=Bacillus sp. MRMR6 TaxID=1928617 RepID=UPI0009514033|nr:hypothetical protein [Bacillus sp. MRMR6]OLS35565.1 hypothetical protein BTR25_19340 [Bacillus sp. MRMR6]